MSQPDTFPARLAAAKQAMENEEWNKAIQALETIGPVPAQFAETTSNILLYLYISRNQFEKLQGRAAQLSPEKPKDCLVALLLMRDHQIEYAVQIPAEWDIAVWEEATWRHAQAGKFEPKELPLCLHFLAQLNRPQHLEQLLPMAVESGESLETYTVSVVLRCFLRQGWFEQARRVVWFNNLNNIAFERLNFIIDRAEKGTVVIPGSEDRFLKFLRYRFGDSLPAQIPPFSDP